MSGKPSPVVVWRRSILKDETLTWRAKYLALVLMDHMDGAGGSCSLHAARGERSRVSVWAMRNAGISSAVGTR